MDRTKHAFRIIVCSIVAWSSYGSAPALAQQNYPNKIVRVINPNQPGGNSDILFRLLSAKMGESLGQQVVVDYRPGAGGNIGAEMTAKAAPDGYTTLIAAASFLINPSVLKNLPFDAIKDFTPLGLMVDIPAALVTHPSLPVKNVKELIAFAKARPGQLTYGSAGVGSSGHLAGALFDSMTGTATTHVPYKGMSVAVTDLIGGQVSMTFGTSLSVIPQVRSGRLRALATTGAQRTPALPDIPTVAESGVRGYEAGLWYGLVGPARIPPEIVRRLNADMVAVLALPEIRERLLSQGVDARSTTPEAFARLLVADKERWAAVLKRAGIPAE
jgi:tripartite-type tricarboxylate transporter receptor subunit TctC